MNKDNNYISQEEEYIHYLDIEGKGKKALRDYFIGTKFRKGHLTRRYNELTCLINSLPEIEEGAREEEFTKGQLRWVLFLHYKIKTLLELGEYPTLKSYVMACEAVEEAKGRLNIYLFLKRLLKDKTGYDEITYVGIMKKFVKLSMSGTCFEKGRNKPKKYFKTEVLKEIVSNFYEITSSRPSLDFVLSSIISDYSGEGGLIADYEDIDYEARKLFYYPKGYQGGVTSKTVTFERINNQISEIYKKISS